MERIDEKIEKYLMREISDYTFDFEDSYFKDLDKIMRKIANKASKLIETEFKKATPLLVKKYGKFGKKKEDIMDDFRTNGELLDVYFGNFTDFESFRRQ